MNKMTCNETRLRSAVGVDTYVAQSTSIEAIISLLVSINELTTLVLCIINRIVQRTSASAAFLDMQKEKFFSTPYVALHSDTSGDHVNANPKNLLSTRP